MIHKEFTFNLYNTELSGKYFKPKTVDAVIVLVHGMGEHSKRYEKFVIPFFNNKSISVITYDQFGHGKTEGKRGHNPGFDAVLECVDEMLKKAEILFANKPVFLYGHSMGGNVVTNYVLRKESNLKGVIATSPFLRLAFSPSEWKLAIGKALLKFAPSVTMGNELDIDAISRDKEAIEEYKNDRMIHDKISPNYSVVFIETGEWAIENADRLKIPMLLMHGTGDRITSYKGSKAFAKNAKDLVDLQLFENGYHELHNDINKKEVLEQIMIWINKNIT